MTTTMAGKDACDYVMSLAREKSQYVEIRYIESVMDQFVLKNGNPEIGGFIRSSGIGLRVLVDGCVGFSSINVLNKSSIDQSVKEAIKLAKNSHKLRKKPIQFSSEKAVEGKYAVKEKKPIKDIHPEDKMKVLFELDKTLSSQPIPFRIVFLMDNQQKRYFINSEGSKIEAIIPRLMFFGLITAVSPVTKGMEQSMLQYGATGGYEWIDKWNLSNVLSKEASTLANIASCSEKPPTGLVDFIVGPSVAGIIAHENCGHPSEGDRILGREAAQAGESYLNKDRLGDRIGSEYVTVIDDPTIEGSFGYYLYDDEGVPARPRYLIKNGIFNEMLHNKESAFVMNTQSTGAARCSGYNREPIPRMSNTFIAPGDFKSLEELVEDIKLGIYMVNYSEWNIDDRRYQSKYVGKEAYLIKDGEITDLLIKRPPLETTTPDLFSAIDGATKGGMHYDAATCGKGDPMQGVPVWTGGAAGTRIRNIKL